VLREGRRATRACDLRQLAVRVCASVRPRGRARRARREVVDDEAWASDRGALQVAHRRRPRGHDTCARRADPGDRRRATGRVDLPQGDGPPEVGVPDRRGRRSAFW